MTKRNVSLRWGIGCFVALSFSIASVVVISLNHKVGAVAAVDFKPGHIIDDGVFVNKSSMNQSQIQSFLNAKVPACDTLGAQPSEFGGGTRRQWAEARGYSPPYTCLRDYTEGGRPSAQIIYDTAQEFSINPQVLIVLLQKEQGLVTDTWPLSKQYRTAAGYGCPDTAACDTTYYGFTNQIRWAARMFRAIMDDSPTWYTPYVLGNNSIRWSPTASCGASTIFIENRATQALYNYTPYQPNQAALNSGYGSGDSCSAYGNRNFYLYFRDWFGYNGGPVAFKTSSSSTTYLNISGYKMVVPYGAAMQDYGISYDSIQTVSQSYADSIPSPDIASGVSQSIGHVVKSPSDSDEDGGSVYLIAVGKRYQFQTVQQIYDFGFKESDIAYLPLGYLFSKQDGGVLPYFVKAPNNTLFEVDGTSKRVLFEYSTYITNNPSDQTALLSYYLIDKIPSGPPLTDRPVLLKYSSGDSVMLYMPDGSYASIPTYETYLCWGFESTMSTPVYRLAQDNYIATPAQQTPLSCFNSDPQNGSAILSAGTRVPVPASFGISFPAITSSLASPYSKLPVRATPLSQYVKTPSDAAVWRLNSLKRRVIPTYDTFLSLSLTDGMIDKVSSDFLSFFSNDGILLANGQIVKDSSSAAVYVVDDAHRYAFATSDAFLVYNNTWNGINTVNAQSLDQNYPISQNVSPILVQKSSSKAFVVASNGCYVINDTSSLLGKTIGQLTSVQPYDATMFRYISLSNCRPATDFMRVPGQSLVYYIHNGYKHAITTYPALLQQNGGTEPLVMTVDSLYINSLPTN